MTSNMSKGTFRAKCQIHSGVAGLDGVERREKRANLKALAPPDVTEP